MCAGSLIVAMGFAGLGWVCMVLFLFAVGVVLSLWWVWRFWFLLLIVVRVTASEYLWWVLGYRFRLLLVVWVWFVVSSVVG